MSQPWNSGNILDLPRDEELLTTNAESLAVLAQLDLVT